MNPEISDLTFKLAYLIAHLFQMETEDNEYGKVFTKKIETGFHKNIHTCPVRHFNIKLNDTKKREGWWYILYHIQQSI